MASEELVFKVYIHLLRSRSPPHQCCGGDAAARGEGHTAPSGAMASEGAGCSGAASVAGIADAAARAQAVAGHPRAREAESGGRTFFVYVPSLKNGPARCLREGTRSR